MCVAVQYATKGVRVNSVLPGAIMTEALETMAERNGVPVEEQYAKLAKFHAMQRVGHADEVVYYVKLHLQGAQPNMVLPVALEAANCDKQKNLMYPLLKVTDGAVMLDR